MNVNGWLANRRFDVDAAIVGLILALLLFPLRFFAAQIYIKTIPIVLGVACITYLLAHRNREDSQTVTLPTWTAKALPSVVLAGSAGLILLARFQGVRSVLFYDLAGALGTLVVLQIALVSEDDMRRDLLLTQVVVLSAVVRLMGLYTNPGFIGLDIWTHVPRLAESIMQERSLSAISQNKHYAAPFYHLYVVGNALLFDSSLRTALYLSLGLVIPLTVIPVYATTNMLVEERWAILAASFYSVADYVTEWSLHLIPTSHGLFLFLGVLYMVVRIMRVEYRMRDFVVLFALTVGLILTHQVSTFIMLVLLTAALVAQLLMKYGPFGASSVLDPNPFKMQHSVNLAGLLVFDSGFTLFMWSFTPYAGADQPFLSLLISYLLETLRSSAGLLNLVSGSDSAASGANAAGQTMVKTLSLYIGSTGFLLLLFATFVGCLYVVNRKRATQPTFTLLIASAVMLVFVLGLPLFGIRNFVPQRWFAFLYGPMAVLGAIGIRTLARSLDHRVFVAVVLLFALIYPSMMVMSNHGDIDNPVFGDVNERLSYTEQEIAAVHSIGEMTGSPDRDQLTARQVLYTDHPYQTVFTRTRSYPADPAILNKSRPLQHEFTVYREYQSHGASFFLRSETSGGVVMDIDRSRLCRPSMGRIYTNGQVSACSTP